MIYVIFTCDKWETPSSMKLLTATSSKDKVLEVALKELDEGDASIKDWQCMYEDIECTPDVYLDDIIDNELIEGLHIITVEDGERIEL